MLSFCNPLCKDRQESATPLTASLLSRRLFNVTFDAFQRDAAIPALNRTGITPVGVFYPEKELSPIYMLLRHRSAESLLTSTQKLLADAEYLRKGADFLNAPADKPAFQRMESSLLLAFKNMPTLVTPVSNPGRVARL